LIKEIKATEPVQRYSPHYLSVRSDKENYEVDDYIGSFKHVHEKGADDCDRGRTGCYGSDHY
jgi:hypothetical protein